MGTIFGDGMGSSPIRYLKPMCFFEHWMRPHVLIVGQLFHDDGIPSGNLT